MIEETGRVVALEAGAVWVETVRRSTCESCSASKGCGHALLDGGRAGARARVLALADFPLEVGQTVVLGLPEGALLRGALMVYLFPLLLLLAGALSGEALAGPAGHGAAVGGLAGLAVGFAVNRWYSLGHRQDRSLHPQVLRRLS